MCRTTTKCCTKAATKMAVKAHSTKVHNAANKKVSNKSVRFSDSDNKVQFRHAPKEELQMAWYQPQEYKVFHYDRLSTIRTLRHAKGDLSVLDPNSQCVRGLEMNATPEIFKYRASGIKTTIRSVLQHQHVQRQIGLKDPTSLGMVSMVKSTAARHLAAALALIDEQSL
ncbi:expressed unknown protein [Seminavis robusta]|uniref:Uncharacterized protein n=1 Tax=Seminavis robusta TaxID=568900 RepID=A0A9N8DMG6_9STRA|nr:expressed unknown protein [Seminavis robusta]|eukprot:Sro241_g096260.1 n/a (169) ;mRNA; f:11935-12441